MEHIEQSADIRAKAEDVWHILTDPTYLPKLIPDLLSMETDPPGRSVVGQKTKTIVKVGRRKLVLYSEVTKLEPPRLLVTKNKEDRLFKTFEQVVTIETRGAGVRVKISFDYAFAIGFVGKILNAVVVERALRDNLRAYAAHLKEFAELEPFS